MTRLEVRCCCSPHKLMGWIDIRRDDASSIICHLIEPVDSRPDPSAPLETITLEIATLDFPMMGASYQAIKAEGVPIETLRRIPGFMENTGE